jgi:hypothetical protein
VPTGTTAEQLAVGDDFVCALGKSGQVKCFGGARGVVGQEPKEAFSTIAAGDDYVCGFTTSHQLSCWGSMLNMPPADFVAP